MGKGKLLSDIHPAGSSYTGDKVFLCCGTKGTDGLSPSSPAPFPSPPSRAAAVTELPVPWLLLTALSCAFLAHGHTGSSRTALSRFLKT